MPARRREEGWRRLVAHEGREERQGRQLGRGGVAVGGAGGGAVAVGEDWKERQKLKDVMAWWRVTPHD